LHRFSKTQGQNSKTQAIQYGETKGSFFEKLKDDMLSIT